MRDYTVSPRSLPSVSLAQTAKIPEHISGIYFAMRGGKILYVGKSVNIKSRWHGHHKKQELLKIDKVRIHWLIVPPEEITAIESVMINKYNPPLNSVKPGTTPNAWELYNFGDFKKINKALMVMGITMAIGISALFLPKNTLSGVIINTSLFLLFSAEAYLISKMGEK